MVSQLDRIYYEKEIGYLREEARIFAERHPEIARFLNFSETDAHLRDPHAERILEGFAFLMGKLNRFLDAQYPELVHSLFDLLFPQYLQALPCHAMVQFSVRESMIDKPQTIPKGTEVYAVGLGPKGQNYRFTSCWDLKVQPIWLRKVFTDPELGEDYSLSLRLALHEGAQTTDCAWDELEFAIHGEPSVRLELFYQLHENLKGIRIRDAEGWRYPLTLVWSGFQEDHDYFVEPRGRFSQLHYLRDFFHDPRRFLFFRIQGLQAVLESLKNDGPFQVDFLFNKPFATGIHPGEQNIKLYCCVVQNLYAKPCEPIDVEEERLDYQLCPDFEREDEEVHSITDVMTGGPQGREPIRPYYRFDHLHMERPRQWFYTQRRDTDLDRGWRTMIRFLDMNHQGPGALAGQTVSVTALCFNRSFAEKLKLGQIKRVSSHVPETISVTNISLPTKAAWPPLHSREEWDFLAHMALDYSELGDEFALKTLLSLYQYEKSDSGRRKIDGIKKVVSKRDILIHQGCCIQGQQLQLEVDGSFFISPGDIALFTAVFTRFLNAFCPINSFIKLQVKELDSGIVFHGTAMGEGS